MEPFVDFGLFEVLAVSGIVALARFVYRRRLLARFVVIVSTVSPAALLFTAHDELNRLIAVVCLGTSILNAGVLLPLTRAGLSPDSAFSKRK